MVKNPPANAEDVRDASLIPGSGRFPGEGNGSPLQYSCLENPMDRGAWWATVHRVAKSWTRLSDFTFTKLETENYQGFPGGSEGKASACNAGDLGSIPGSGRSPGEGNGNPLQCSCLENPMDGGAWWATVHRVSKSWTRLSNFTHSLTQSKQHCQSRREYFLAKNQQSSA